MITRITKPWSVHRQDHQQLSFRILQLFICSPAGRGGEEEALPSQQAHLSGCSQPGLPLPPTAGAQGVTTAPCPPVC